MIRDVLIRPLASLACCVLVFLSLGTFGACTMMDANRLGVAQSARPLPQRSATRSESRAEKAGRILNSKLRVLGPSMYPGKCAFSEDLTFAKIYFDPLVWYAIVTGDEETKSTYMDYFFNMTWEAAREAGHAGERPYFHLCDNDGRVMARGIVISGEPLPNYVDPVHWKSW